MHFKISSILAEKFINITLPHILMICSFDPIFLEIEIANLLLQCLNFFKCTVRKGNLLKNLVLFQFCFDNSNLLSHRIPCFSKVYAKIYSKLVEEQQYQKSLNVLRAGKNILIIEFDGVREYRKD